MRECHAKSSHGSHVSAVCDDLRASPDAFVGQRSRAHDAWVINVARPLHMGGKRRRQEERQSYAGWRPVAGAALDHVRLGDLTPGQFFERHVAQRKPVVLTGGLPDARWHLWTDDYLRARAGDALVRVEARASTAVAFGASRHQQLRFGDFLDRLVKHRDELLYLTTEATQFDAHGRLSVVSPPLTHLLGDVPLRPAVMGSLVPAALNLWMGSSRNGASSGLHHDWHDNLYSLLRGRKRFELYAPSESAKLYPYGEVSHIHANGRIVYKGAGAPCRADGADDRDLARVALLDVRLAEANLAATEASKQPARLRRAAEAALDAALEAQLDAGGGDEWHDDGAGDASGDDGGEEGDAPPPHFSRVRMDTPQQQVHDEFPLFSTAVCTTVEIGAGELLYLPAGWWHNVTSWSSPGGSSSSQTHLAVNWWFAPPDTARFDQPYGDDLWERDWKHWCQDILPTLPAMDGSRGAPSR